MNGRQRDQLTGEISGVGQPTETSLKACMAAGIDAEIVDLLWMSARRRLQNEPPLPGLDDLSRILEYLTELGSVVRSAARMARIEVIMNRGDTAL